MSFGVHPFIVIAAAGAIAALVAIVIACRAKSGLVIAMMVVLALVFIAPADYVFLAFRPDIGQRIYELGRPTTGDADVLPLGDTGFRAVVCASHYTDTKDTDPDFYSISVERQNSAGWRVYFERQFPASGIPASVLTAKPRNIVSFEPARRLVTFTVGATNYSYKLPPTP
jgi:hypothetical protein